jgi:hypothetical protein
MLPVKEGFNDWDKSASIDLGATASRQISPQTYMTRHRGRIARVITIASFALVFVGFLMGAISRIRVGGGGDTYRNVYGLEISYVSFLISLAVFLLILAVALIFRWKDSRQLRRIGTKRLKLDDV